MEKEIELEDFELSKAELSAVVSGRDFVGMDHSEILSDFVGSNLSNAVKATGNELNLVYDTDFFLNSRDYIVFGINKEESLIIDNLIKGAIFVYSGEHVKDIDYLKYNDGQSISVDSRLLDYINEEFKGRKCLNDVQLSFNKLVADKLDNAADEIKNNLDVSSFKEWVMENAQIKEFSTVSFSELFSHLENNNFNLHNAVTSAASNGSYNPDDFISDIESHFHTLKKLETHKDFSSVCFSFDINSSNLTEIDLDRIKERLEQDYEPEVKKKNKLKM